jgi:hypothetical protein
VVHADVLLTGGDVDVEIEALGDEEMVEVEVVLVLVVVVVLMMRKWRRWWYWMGRWTDIFTATRVQTMATEAAGMGKHF